MAATAVTPKEPARLAEEPASNVCVVDIRTALSARSLPVALPARSRPHLAAPTCLAFDTIADAAAYRFSGIPSACTTMPFRRRGFQFQRRVSGLMLHALDEPEFRCLEHIFRCAVPGAAGNAEGLSVSPTLNTSRYGDYPPRPRP